MLFPFSLIQDFKFGSMWYASHRVEVLFFVEFVGGKKENKKNGLMALVLALTVDHASSFIQRIKLQAYQIQWCYLLEI